MVSLIIRERNHQHWINISVQGFTPILKDNQMSSPIPLTTEQLGDNIKTDMESPGAVFFLSSDTPVVTGDTSVASGTAGNTSVV